MVGITDVIPKLIASRILEPVMSQGEEVRVVCYEDKQERLLAELAVHALDVVITDEPVASGTSVRAYSHLLGESGVTLFAKKEQAERLRRHFPKSLDGAPFLLPTENTPLRRALTRWFEEEKIRPKIRGEFQDSALLKAFGQIGVGVFPGASAMEDEVRQQYGVAVVGRIESVRERFYAVTVDRKLRHPAVVAISEAARNELFERGTSAE